MVTAYPLRFIPADSDGPQRRDEHSAAEPQPNRSATGPRSQRQHRGLAARNFQHLRGYAAAAGGDRPRAEIRARREDFPWPARPAATSSPSHSPAPNPLPNPAVLASGRRQRHPRKQARTSPSAARLQRNGGGNFRRLRPAPRAATGDRSRSLGGGSVALCSSYRCGPLSIGDCLDTAYPQPTHRCPGRALGPLLRGLPAPPPAPPPAAPRFGLP